MDTQFTKEERIMMTQTELFKVAAKEKGSQLTPMDEWFVWSHPTMTFQEIRAMLDLESKEWKELDEKMKREKNIPNWPRFG